jgi:hypothetical protein
MEAAGDCLLPSNLILYNHMNYIKLDLGVIEMFLTPKEIPVFKELLKNYRKEEAFNMILNGYKPLPYKNLVRI